jgi:glucose uptake protein GlcU
LGGILIPSFGSFGYYFVLDVVKISKFTIAMLGVVGYICLMIGSFLYHKYFTKTEFRRLMVYNTIIGLMFAPLNMLFVLRKNEEYGLPDMFVILFTDIVLDTLSQCMVLLPLMVLFAKITPKRIEATCFAFLTGTCNMTSGMRSLVGSFVNRNFVGVT